MAGPVAVVTGAASGIGQAAAIAFAGAGYRVGLLDIDGDGAAATLATLSAEGGEGIALSCDVADEASVSTAHAAVLREFGTLDAAVNAAGIEGAWHRLADEPLELFDRVIAINLRGVRSCMIEQIRAMQAGAGGAIVNVASGAGLVGSARSAAYAVSKHGVIGLTKSAALQYAADGIRINAVCPGGVDTPMAARIVGSAAAAGAVRGPGKVALGRYSTPEEIAGAALWLCGPFAKSVIGVALPVDGGMTAA